MPFRIFKQFFSNSKHMLLHRLNLLLLGNKQALSFKHPLDAEAEESKLQTAWKRQEQEDEYL